MVVIGPGNKFYLTQQVKLISILENERAILIEYSFHWQWWDIFPLLVSGADHMEVDILPSPFPSPPVYEVHPQKRDLRYNLRDSRRSNFKERVWLKEFSRELNLPQHHPAVVKVTHKSDIELKDHCLIQWVIYALPFVQKRIGSIIKEESLSHGWKVGVRGGHPFPILLPISSQSQHPFHWAHVILRISIQCFRQIKMSLQPSH